MSIGAHPTSGRPRRAEQDARAVELGCNWLGDKLQVLHAGAMSACRPAVPLGMGSAGTEQPGRRCAAGAQRVSARRGRPAGTDRKPGRNRRRSVMLFLLVEQLGWLLIVGLAQVIAGVALLQALASGGA